MNNGGGRKSWELRRRQEMLNIVGVENKCHSSTFVFFWSLEALAHRKSSEGIVYQARTLYLLSELS